MPMAIAIWSVPAKGWMLIKNNLCRGIVIVIPLHKLLIDE